MELGAGIGNLTALLLGDERAVVAIDTDEQMIERHRQRVPATTRLLMECVSLQELARRPSYRERFDSVISANVLEHVPDLHGLHRFVASHNLYRSRTFEVDRFVLFSSRPTRGGGPYAVEESYDLQAAQ